MKAENCYADGDKYFKNYKEELVLIDAEKHLAWKEHYEIPLNGEFHWNKEVWS